MSEDLRDTMKRVIETSLSPDQANGQSTALSSDGKVARLSMATRSLSDECLQAARAVIHDDDGLQQKIREATQASPRLANELLGHLGL